MLRSKVILLLLPIIMIFSSVLGVGTIRMQESSADISSDSWHFISLGDSRQQHGDWDYDNDKYFHDNSSNPTRAAIFTSVVENNPNLEFILHTGDVVSAGGEQDDWNRYYEDIVNATQKNTTFYYAIGNHERYNYALGPGSYAPADEDFSVFEANVELPGNERYYSFDYMNQIHFVFINTEEDWTGQFDITTDQYNWLISDLESNSLDFVVAVYHRPSYSVRDSGRVHDAQEVRAVLDPIFINYGVDLVFSGHDHYYYHTVRNGITYVTAGGAGADLYTNGDTSEWQDSDVYFSEFHYCNISVTESAGVVTADIDVFLFNETDHTISLGDSFSVNSTSTGTTTTSDTTTSTTTTVAVSTTSTSSSTLPTTTTSDKTTPFTFSLIFGILVLIAIRKRK